MMTDPRHPAPSVLRPSDGRRYAAHATAAADPEIIMTAIDATFSDLHVLVRRGERVAAAGAAAVVTRRVLELCAVEAETAKRATDKVRFVDIIARWSVSRNPSLTAVLTASETRERNR